MANIQAMSLTRDGLSITACDGRNFSLTRAQAIAIFQSQSGNRAAKIVATIQLVRNQIISAIGAEQVSLSELGFDFDDIQGLKHLKLGQDPDSNTFDTTIP